MPKPDNMRVTFWGTRGSCPTFPAPWEIQEYARRVSVATVGAAFGLFAKDLEQGKSLDEFRRTLERAPEELAGELAITELPVFGGETTCVEVETSEGNTIILDGGSGIRQCASKILSERDDTGLREIYFFGSHEHLDHRLGLPFATICFANPPFHIRVFGNSGFLKALDEHFGFFSRTVSESTYHDDPIDYVMMTASFEGIEIRSPGAGKKPKAEGLWGERDIADPIRIGSTVVRAFEAYHGATGCLGYRIEHGGKSFVFCTDHETLPIEGDGPQNEAVRESRRAERGILEICRGADLAYFDGQYFREEYYGRQRIGSSPAVPRIGWGHSCIEDILEKVQETGIQRALIGHHDPERSWPAQIEMNEDLRAFSAKQDFRVELARDGQIIDL